MKVSLIIPAFNEEKELPACLEYIRQVQETLSSQRVDVEWQLIVTDNNSTDSTAEIAKNAGAEVVFEPVNQIARARNAGARLANGDWYLFIDADSRLHVDSIRDMLHAIASSRIGGGGCLVRMDDAPRWGKCSVFIWNALSRSMGWAAGSFVFCRAEAFRDVGGFNEEFYAAEELHFSSQLRGWCKQKGLKFKILTRQPHASSSRKFRMYSKREMLRLFRSVCFSYGRTIRNQAALDFFYDGRR